MIRLFQTVLTVGFSFVFLSVPGMAQEETEYANIPHVSKRARVNFGTTYLFAEEHKAFAIAPGGAWSWSAEQETEEKAKESALARCDKFTQQKCVLFSVNDRIVFDHKTWPTLWGPYLNKEQVAQAPVGNKVGERYYDLLITRDGKEVKLSDMRGKVVLLHFWGSWCPPCCHELPVLQQLYESILKEQLDVEVVLVQIREPYSVAQAWLKSNKLTLPSYDSGAKGEADEQLRLADGSRIGDRKLAKVFPSTYVLDRNGVVVFSRMGPISKWPEYLPFFKDLLTRTQ